MPPLLQYLSPPSRTLTYREDGRNMKRAGRRIKQPVFLSLPLVSTEAFFEKVGSGRYGLLLDTFK